MNNINKKGPSEILVVKPEYKNNQSEIFFSITICILSVINEVNQDKKKKIHEYRQNVIYLKEYDDFIYKKPL